MLPDPNGKAKAEWVLTKKNSLTKGSKNTTNTKQMSMLNKQFTAQEKNKNDVINMIMSQNEKVPAFKKSSPPKIVNDQEFNPSESNYKS